MQLLNCTGPYLNEPLATLFQTEDAAKELFGPPGCCLQLVISTSSPTCTLLPPATKLGQGYIFTGVCDSVHRGEGMHGCRGACVVAGGGHVWLPGGMHDCQGACVVARGHAWLPGGCMAVGGHAWLWGACMVAGRVCMGYDEIRSMSGQYASYWNAFLLNKVTARGAEHLKQKTPFTLKAFQLKDSFHSKAFHLEEPFHSESLSPERPLSF